MIKPNVAPTRGSTRHLPRFDIDVEPLLFDFIKIVSRRPHSLTKAKQIAIGIAKYFASANPTSAQWAGLIDVNKVKQYIQKLTKDRIGLDQLTTKTDRLTQAVKYGTRDKLIDSNTAHEAIDRFST